MKLKKLILPVIAAIVLSCASSVAFNKLTPFIHENYKVENVQSYKSTLISCKDPVLSKIIYDALKRVDESGYPLPPAIVIDRDEYAFLTGSTIDDPDGGVTLGETNIPSYIIYVNAYSYKYDIDLEFKTIFHEIGHYIHISKIMKTRKPVLLYESLITGKVATVTTKEFEQLKPKITLILGDYAATTPYEFVASYFSARMRGFELPEDLSNLYYSLGGEF